jgi:hypothetical protein
MYARDTGRSPSLLALNCLAHNLGRGVQEKSRVQKSCAHTPGSSKQRPRHQLALAGDAPTCTGIFEQLLYGYSCMPGIITPTKWKLTEWAKSITRERLMEGALLVPSGRCGD